MSASLTKKQQKALAFRSKQKAKSKGLPEPDDVPELDLLEGNGVEPDLVNEVSISEGSKKRKRQETKLENGGRTPSQKSKKFRDENSKDNSETASGDKEGDADANNDTRSKKEIKQRFILFIGNLDFKTRQEEIQAHFAEAIGRMPSVRLLTEKKIGPGKPKSRGIAFLELLTSTELQACLRLHESLLGGRKINVELTAGGGGKGATRKGKIDERNKRIGSQREKRAERENGAEVVESGAVVEASSEGEVKSRGGRRIRAKPQEDVHNRQNQRVENAAQSRTWARGRGGEERRSIGTGGYGRKKWEPTGANALAVG